VRALLVAKAHAQERSVSHYDKDKRDALRKIEAATWYNGFAQYLKDLNCPRPFKAGMNADETAVAGPLLSESVAELLLDAQVVLDWLLSHAVAAEYTDHGALLLAVAASSSKLACSCTIQPSQEVGHWWRRQASPS
jgi:hypothetical protein